MQIVRTCFRSRRAALAHIAAGTCCAAAVLLSGCGGSTRVDAGGGGSGPATAPYFIVSPASQTAPLASTITLSASAVGTAPLAYQWYENGNPVAGATGTSLTVGPLSSTDAGDTFTVKVTNAAGSAVSDPGVLKIGARSPAARDLRFKHVGFPAALGGFVASTNIIANVPGNHSSYSLSNTLGSPLGIGNASCLVSPSSTSCSWPVVIEGTPVTTTGFNVLYSSDTATAMDQDLASLAPNVVVTSLDEQTRPGIFAVSLEQDGTVPSGYTMTRAAATDANLQTTVQGLASQGIVVTAVSGANLSGMDLIGYSWSGESGVHYDADTILTSYGNVSAAASALAAQGDIITAVGTGDANQLVLIGTRVHGDAIPRSLSINGSSKEKNLRIVGFILGNDSARNDQAVVQYAIEQ